MRILLVQRPFPWVKPEDLTTAPDPSLLCEPVAIICVAHDVTDEEMNVMGRDVLASIGDKAVDANKIMYAYSILARL